MSKFILFLVAAVIIVGGIWLYSGMESGVTPESKNVVLAADPLNASYQIEGMTITLTSGRSEISAAEGSAAMISTEIFGEPVYGDIDGDGDEDAGVLIKQEPGGTGTFYYMAAAIKSDDGYEGTNALLLGDRVAPQGAVQISGGEVVANYADRAVDEPMSATPSVGKTLRAKFDKGKMVEVRVADVNNPAN